MARTVKGTNVKRYREVFQGGTWERSRAGAERAVCVVRAETHYLEPDASGDKSDVRFTLTGSPSDVWGYLVECLPTVRLEPSDSVNPDTAQTVTVFAVWSY